MKVLIADDSNFILERLKNMLSKIEQVELIACFQNGIEALEAIREMKPDLAVLDNKMPGLKGIDIIRTVRQEDQKVTLMLLTFYANAYYKQKALQAGANYIFSKSDDFEKIPDTIIKLKSNSI